MLPQTRPGFEVIVVDGGSTGGAGEMLRTCFADVDKVTHQGSRGACAARNRGLDSAQGDFAAFLDPEDAWCPLETGLKDLHRRRWAGRGEPNAFAPSFFEAFCKRLIAEGFPAGCVELAKMSAGSEALGCLCDFLYPGTVLSYRSGFACEDAPKLKPGLVSHRFCIEEAAKPGRDVYDLVAGHSRQKASLGRRGPDTLYLLLQRPTASIKGVNLPRRLAKAAVQRCSAP